VRHVELPSAYIDMSTHGQACCKQTKFKSQKENWPCVHAL
jgi:hypothetical protein